MICSRKLNLQTEKLLARKFTQERKIEICFFFLLPSVPLLTTLLTSKIKNKINTKAKTEKTGRHK